MVQVPFSDVPGGALCVMFLNSPSFLDSYHSLGGLPDYLRVLGWAESISLDDVQCIRRRCLAKWRKPRVPFVMSGHCPVPLVEPDSVFGMPARPSSLPPLV